jgi:hypothetical protein
MFIQLNRILSIFLKRLIEHKIHSEIDKIWFNELRTNISASNQVISCPHRNNVILMVATCNILNILLVITCNLLFPDYCS